MGGPLAPSTAALVALSGLPGSGKTTVARCLARRLGAFHIRIDSIEVALKQSTLRIDPAVDAGYMAAYAVAADNLAGANVVVADSVNPIALTRDAWADVANRAGATLLEVEIVCSDAALHRQRVEDREADMVGQFRPTWAHVIARDYAPWTRDRLVLDTAILPAQAAADRIAAALSDAAARREAP